MHPSNHSRIFSFTNIFTEFKTSMRLAIPMIATELIYALTGFVATVMVAHLGKEQLAANALVWGIYLTVVVFFIGILSSVSIMVSHSFGAKDERGISVCFKQGLILAIICALPMMLIMWLSPIVLVWTGQDPAVILAAKPLFYALIWCMLPINLSFVMEQFLVGITKTHIVTISVSLSVPVQIFLYYIFVFGKLGLAKFGLAGIGYGNLVEHSLVTVFFIFYLNNSKQLKIYHLFSKWWQVNKKFLLEMISIGYPLGAMYCVELSLIAAVAIMMGKLGTDVLAAYQISYQYWMIALVILFALTQAIAVRVGNEVGRNNRDAVKLAMIVNLGISLIFMLVFSIAYIAFPYTAISLDIDVHAPHLQQVVKMAAKFLAMISFLILSDCIRLISFGALRGLKDTKFPMLTSIIGFWCIAFPCAYFLAFKYKFGGIGIWWGITIGIFAAGVMLALRFFWLYKRIDLSSLVTRS